MVVTYAIPKVLPDGKNPTLIRRAFQGVNRALSVIELHLDTLVGAEEHALLSTKHTDTDTAAGTPSRGSLIIGNSTPDWDEMTLGSSGHYITSNGTDISWSSGTLNEAIDDRVGSLIQDGTYVTWVYNDAGNTLTGDISTVPNHDHTGDAGDGAQISHDSALTGISADDHHAQVHNMSTHSDEDTYNIDTSGTLTAGGPWTLNQNSDTLVFSLDGLSAFIKWSDGSLFLETDEADANAYVQIRGKGTGYGVLRVWDENNGEYLELSSVGGTGIINTAGSSPGSLYIQKPAHSNVYFFADATSNETKEIYIAGYRSGDQKRYLAIGVGTDAADTASFDGLSNYLFNGNVTANLDVRGRQLIADGDNASVDSAVSFTNVTIPNSHTVPHNGNFVLSVDYAGLIKIYADGADGYIPFYAAL